MRSKTPPYSLALQPSPAPLPTEDEARADALARGHREAATRCAPLRHTARLLSAWAKPQTWSCTSSDAGHTCGFDGHITCRIKRRVHVERERCPPGADASL